MNWLIVGLRIIHIVAGVFWAGSVFAMTGFVLPTAAASGPEGGRFMRRLTLDRGLTRAMIAAGVVTVIAGLALMGIDSAGVERVWFRSGMGVTISFGALSAVGALVSGLRSAALVSRLGKLAQTIEAQGAAASPELVAQIQQSQPRLAALARATAVQLAIAVVCMAAARYVGV